MEIKAIKTKVFQEGEDITRFIFKYFKKIPEKSVVVVTSKIVAISEGRLLPYESKAQKAALIKRESTFALKTKRTWLTVKDGMVMSSAGIDESNANGKLILLPKDSFRSADKIRKEIRKKYKIKKIGVLITDSRLFPLRAGVVGVALGYAGFKAIRDYRGSRDIFGRVLKMSRTDVGDSLATAAVLCMGEGKEQQPLALITGAPVQFVEKVNKKELLIDPKEDLYLPFFGSILNK